MFIVPYAPPYCNTPDICIVLEQNLITQRQTNMAKAKIDLTRLKSAAAKKATVKKAVKTTGTKATLQVRPVKNPKLTGVWQPNPSGGLKVSRNPVGRGNFNPQMGRPPLQMTSYGPIRLR